MVGAAEGTGDPSLSWLGADSCAWREGMGWLVPVLPSNPSAVGAGAPSNRVLEGAQLRPWTLLKSRQFHVPGQNTCCL